MTREIDNSKLVEAVLKACKDNNIEVKRKPNMKLKSAIVSIDETHYKITKDLNIYKVKGTKS